MKIIRGKRAVVTGAASGIGRAIALDLAQEGADLFLIDIDAEKLAATGRVVRDHGVEAITAICDLSEPTQISAAVENLRSAWSAVNILINNAGIAYFWPNAIDDGRAMASHHVRQFDGADPIGARTVSIACGVR
jgi:short-subunit dehydrogenase